MAELLAELQAEEAHVGWVLNLTALFAVCTCHACMSSLCACQQQTAWICWCQSDSHSNPRHVCFNMLPPQVMEQTCPRTIGHTAS